MNKWGCIKRFPSVGETIDKLERQPADGEEILLNYVFGKKVIKKIVKNPITIRKQPTCLRSK